MMLGANITLRDFFLKNLVPVTLGNFIGGALFVGAIYRSAFGAKTKEQVLPV